MPGSQKPPWTHDMGHEALGVIRRSCLPVSHGAVLGIRLTEMQTVTEQAKTYTYCGDAAPKESMHQHWYFQCSLQI